MLISRRRRRTKIRVVPYRSRQLLKWTIAGYYVNGKRVRRFFENKQDAQTFVERIEVTAENLGTRATGIDPRFHVMALECHDLLVPYGKTLADATDFYRHHLNAVQRSCTVNELVASLLQHKEAEGTGDRYRKELRNRLNRFQRRFGEQIVATFTTLQCDDWLRSLALAPLTRNGYRLVLNVLFGYAKDRGYCTENPITKTAIAKIIDKPVGVLTPEQTESLLVHAPKELKPTIAIGAFAGLRTAELALLDWSEVHLDRKFIEVSAAKSKTARRRLVTILPNLALWLSPLVRKEGPVMPANFVNKMKVARNAAGIENWPANGLRHSYASYHLAKFQDAPALALQMGHTTTAMLFAHYREVVTPEDAEKYWNVYP